MNRRDFLQSLVGMASAAGLAACRRSEQSIYNYVTQPEGLTAGVARHYATALTQLDTAFGVIVETYDAHPTKIEGNPKHPESRGGTTAQLQAALFDLYDVDRSHGPSERGAARSWAEAEQMLDKLRAELTRDGGASCAILIEPHRSPTLSAELEGLRQLLPKLRITRYDPLDATGARDATRAILGRSLEMIVDWDSVEVGLLFDADPLASEGSPIASSRGWAGRRASNSRPQSRLYSVESTLSLSGSVADHRWICKSHQILSLLARLACILAELRAISIPDDLLSQLRAIGSRHDWGAWQSRLRVLAQELAARPKRSLLQAGTRQPAVVHGLVHLLNHRLGNFGNTVRFVAPFEGGDAGARSLGFLADEIRAGSVNTLLVVGANPVFSAPGDVDLRAALDRVRTKIHLGTHVDETARLCEWHLNLASELESWSDATAREGTTAIVQPVILPLWGGKTAAEVVARIAGTQHKAAFELVRTTWSHRFGTADFEARWREALIDGVAEGNQLGAEMPEPDLVALGKLLGGGSDQAIPELELVLVPDANLRDGRSANNAWLQELPHPLTKTTWGTPAFISQELAEERRIRDGQLLQLVVQGRAIEVAAVVVPGQASRTITLSLGHGHVALGKHANGVGVNAYPLRTIERPWIVAVDGLSVLPTVTQVARTQIEFDQHGRHLAREQSALELLAAPKPPLRHQTPAAPGQPQAWGMVIDLNRCHGCQACVVACQAENNVPSVGRDAIERGRAMHWLRVDRYYAGSGDKLRIMAQPLPCQQCEHAPCEAVCPAGATVHSPEGLNDMVYNRCVGSRYCANNCPFEVRRFNFFEHNANVVEVERLRMNPEVTVRSRGVMEKCTFCVQRIEEARILTKSQGMSRIKDGTVVPACAQACPTQAIVFGDLSDPNSRGSQQCREPRAYRMLAELNVEPRVHYLSRVRNPHRDA